MCVCVCLLLFRWEDFLGHYIPDAPGPVVELETGRVVGQHRGLHFHTIGQRRGVGPVLVPTEVHRGPWFVAAKAVAANTLLVTTNGLSAAATGMASSGASGEATGKAGPYGGARFAVEDVSWVSGAPPGALRSGGGGSLEAVVQVRHGPTSHAGLLSLKLDGSSGLEVSLAEAAGGLAAGQYAAFYAPDNGVCLGSGVIAESTTWVAPPAGVGVLRAS
jgi:tRNA-specific 2-thiouridylase